jgi:hypothetical protein
MCGLLREKCEELEMDEFYATTEKSMRYALVHLDRKVRITSVERCIDMLVAFGVTLVQIAEFDNSNMNGHGREWYSILERHIAENDERVVVWVKAGKTKSLLTAPSFSSDGGQQASSKRQKRVVPVSTVGVGEDAFRILLAEKDDLLVEKEIQMELALAAKDTQNAISLAEQIRDAALAMETRNDEVRAMLLNREAVFEGRLDCKDNEIAALQTRSDQGDCVVAKLTSTITGLEDKLSRATDTICDLRKDRVEPSQRETMLVVDLNVERRRVREVISQIHTDAVRFAIEHARMSAVENASDATIVRLSGEIETVRHEAREWACDRESARVELDKALADNRRVLGLLDEAQARCGSIDAENKLLRAKAVEIVNAGVQRDDAHWEALAKSRVSAVQRQADHSCREWKRRNEILRDQLAVAMCKLEKMGGC